MQLIPIAVVLVAGGLWSIFKYKRDRSSLAALGGSGGSPKWKVGLVSFLGTLLGVAISIFVADKGFDNREV